MLEPLKPLSRREWEVIELLFQGKSNKLIALSLGISDRTVEFHLKNIYAKCQVSSRIELILKLGNAAGNAAGNATGGLKIGKPGSSTVDSRAENAENRVGSGSSSSRVPAYSDAVSMNGKESTLKNLLVSKHTLTGMSGALLTGFAWIVLLKRFGHMSTSSLMPWIVPILIALVGLGTLIGLAARRNGNSLLKVFFAAVIGTGAGALGCIPVIGLVAYPLAKIGENLGLINRAAVSTNITSALVIVAMLVVWLLIGAVVGIMVLVFTTRKPQHPLMHRGAAEHGVS